MTGSRPRDLGAEIRILSFTVDCDTFSNEEKVGVVVPETGVEVEVTGSEAMFFFFLVKLCDKNTG